MRDLNDIRENIDRVDGAIAKLLEERMELAFDVAKYKISTGKPIYDKDREDEKLSKIRSLATTPVNENVLEEIFTQIMSISRRYQYSIVGDREGYIEKLYTCVEALEIDKSTTVVYQGVHGAFSEQAMFDFFGKEIHNFNVKEFEEVLIAVDKGEADYGILPIENSTAGFVNGIYAMLSRYDLTIVGEHILKAEQSLLGVKGAKLSDIRTVYSHPQGLLQTQEFLNKFDWEQISWPNTAGSAKMVSEAKDISKAAIASRINAAIYGLDILEPVISGEENNSTRFIIVSRDKVYTKSAQKVGIGFSLAHESGTLYNLLAHFIFNGINMASIESVPIPNKAWEYTFFITIEGNLQEDAVRNALKGIREESHHFKILGNF